MWEWIRKIPFCRKCQFNWINRAHAPAATAVAKSLQSCPTLCDPIDSSPPGSPVPGILQARTLEWVAISFSNAWKWKVKVKLLSRVQLFATPWTAAHQDPPSMGFSRQEYWSGVPLPKLLKWTQIPGESWALKEMHTGNLASGCCCPRGKGGRPRRTVRNSTFLAQNKTPPWVSVLLKTKNKFIINHNRRGTGSSMTIISSPFINEDSNY